MVWLKGCYVLLPQLPQNINWNESTRYKIRKKNPDETLLPNESEEEEVHMCTLCSCSFSNESLLFTHTQLAHEKLNDIEDIPTLEHETFGRSKTCQLSTDKFRCEDCNDTFDQESSLAIHIQSVHEKLERLENKSTSEQDTIYQFNSNQHSADEFTCEECDITFDQECSFFIHIKSVRENEKLESCLDNSTIEHDIIYQPMSDAHSVVAFSCKECEIVFDQEHSLVNHNKTVHEKRETFQSNNTVHEGLKPFKCTDSGWEFADKLGITRHVNEVHSRLKPYKCAECDRSFSAKNTLNKHLEIYHKPLNNIKCSQCDWTFLTNKALIRHVDIQHCEIKPLHPSNRI